MVGASQIRVLLVAMATVCLASGMQAQTSKPTIRHHRIVEPAEAPELTAAETALEKKDYAAALRLLEPLAQSDEKDHRVWFDLGFVYNALGRADDSISAYRKAVAAKPDVFESNLNLGLMLARGNHPDAAAFLRAATQLKPASQSGASTS